MGKKRITTDVGVAAEAAPRAAAVSTKKKLASGVVYIQSTYNNTKLMLGDHGGNALLWTTSGALGFKGAKKGTPFAAGKVAETLAERAQTLGLKEIDVVVKGVGAGRESAIRALAARGLIINSIKDATPVPHNGPKPKKPRRV